jgi:hypothetical protein
MTDPPRALPRARGAAAAKPAHSGRGHSTAYTHRHFPLPSLVQGCSDDPLAQAQAPNPHMPQYVYIRNCSQITPPLRSSTFWPWPRRRPTTPRDLPPRHLTAHIARRHSLAFGSYRTYFIARHRPTKTLSLALSQARRSPRTANPDSPLSSFAYSIPAHPKLQRDHRPRTTAATPDFKEPTLPFVLE